jgi:cation transporter-like permease
MLHFPSEFQDWSIFYIYFIVFCYSSNFNCSLFLQRWRQAEAINGALAMIGLTAGLVLEGQTGKGILGQVLKLNI